MTELALQAEERRQVQVIVDAVDQTIIEEAARREGWLRCQATVFAMCEDLQREANEEWPEMDQFSRGMKRAVKSISRGMGALSPDDSATN